MKPFSLDEYSLGRRKVVTRGGKEVILFRTDLAGRMYGAYRAGVGDSSYVPISWSQNGRHDSFPSHDLFFAPKKVTKYTPICKRTRLGDAYLPSNFLFSTKEEAEKSGHKNIIGVAEVTWEE